MRSVPPRGSGWVRCDCLTHPLPRGGTDLIGPCGSSGLCKHVVRSVRDSLEVRVKFVLFLLLWGKHLPQLSLIGYNPGVESKCHLS